MNGPVGEMVGHGEIGRLSMREANFFDAAGDDFGRSITGDVRSSGRRRVGRRGAGMSELGHWRAEALNDGGWCLLRNDAVFESRSSASSSRRATRCMPGAPRQILNQNRQLLAFVKRSGP